MKLLGKVDGVLFFVLLVVSFLCSSDAFFWGRRRRPPPVKRPPVSRPPPKTPARLPYCPLDSRVKNIVEQRRFGREIEEIKRQMSIPWPYNCLHASILKYQGQFTYLPMIAQCCASCSFPAFSTCTSIYGTNPRCPSQGLQCIVKCVRTHDPNTISTGSNVRRCRTRGWSRRTRRLRIRVRKVPFRKLKPTPKILNPKCERKVIRGGKYCIERLCIPIKL